MASPADWLNSEDFPSAVGDEAGCSEVEGYPLPPPPQPRLELLRADHSDLMQVLREWEEWKNFVHQIRANLVVSTRHLLSYHTTTACQIRKEEGTVGSLKDAGLDDVQRSGSGWQVTLRMTNSYERGDGFAFVHVSTVQRSKCEAQSTACLEIWCYLMMVNPYKVLSHPNHWNEGMDTFSMLQRQATVVRGKLANAFGWQPAVGGGDNQPRRPQVSDDERHTTRRARLNTVPAPTEATIRDILQASMLLREGVWYGTDRRRVQAGFGNF